MAGIRLLFFTVLVALASSQTVTTTPSTCVEAHNFLNAQYTVPVNVGTPAQTLHVVADTGSFEGVFASAECVGCGKHLRFDRAQSTSFAAKSPAEHITTLYGQGKVVSEAVYDRVQVGSLVADRQSVLLMQQNELRDYSEASYDGVMGLGVPSVARSQDPSDLSLMANLNVSTVSLCFGQRDGEGGRIELGPRPEDDPLEFVELPLLGDQHWGVVLDGITVGGQAIPGCEEGCNAIIDSGTSLIAAPSEILSPLLEAIGDVDPQCAGIESLPEVTISLAGHNFTLHPQMYVAKMDMADETTRAALGIEKGLMQRTDGEEEQAAEDEYAAAGTAAAGTPATQELGQQDEGLDPLQGFRKRMASLQAGRKTDASSSSAATDLSSQAVHEACVALFMDMDMVSSLPGKPFILGIPFLRAFVSKFDRTARTVALAAVPVGSSYCSACNVTDLAAPSTAAPSATPAAATSVGAAAHANHASHALLGASSLTSGFGATATSEAVHKTALQPSNDLAPTPAESKAAHLEAVGALSLGAGVSTQVLPSKTILLPQQGSVHEQHVHSSSSSKAFHAPRIKLAQLRVPGWVRAAHGEWKKSKQRKQQQKKER